MASTSRLAEVARRAAEAARQRQLERQQPVIHPDKAMRDRDEAACCLTDALCASTGAR